VYRFAITFFLFPAMVVAGGFAQDATNANSSLPPKVQAWTILDSALVNSSYEKRAKAAQALGLIIHDPEAERLAVKALIDERPEVRASGAAALGDIGNKSAIPELHKMFKDTDVQVILASARALLDLGDNSGYSVYYAILTGETKTGTGLLDEQKKMLKDPQKLAQFGFETGIGFIPFAGMGWSTFKMLRKDDTSPILAASAMTLANDPDPKSAEALVSAAETQKSWIVRAAALTALAKRGDPRYIKAAEEGLSDEKEEVQFSAAAAVIHLSNIAEHHSAPAAKRPAPRKKR
jgi:HEAT repeat protein